MSTRTRALLPSTTRPHRIVVLGAGYAGVLAANRILTAVSKPGHTSGAVHLTVVNPRPDFVERIRLHQVIAGTARTATRPMSEMLHERATQVTGTAVQIDADARSVHVEQDGTMLPLAYDTLLYAVGSHATTQVPGVREHALPSASAEDAAIARERIAGLPPEARVAVVGGGLTGIELASEIAERRPDLRVVLLSSGEIASGLSDGGRRRLLRELGRLGVDVQSRSRVARVEAGQLVLADQAPISFDACVWAASFAVPDLARRSGLATDAIGRLRVDETLTSLDRPDIVGAGDAVVTPDAVGHHLRMSCAAALPLGGHAADTILARLRGEPATPISVGFGGQCISLGRRRGLVQMVRRDDTPRDLVISGPVGAWTKERICRYTVSTVRAERRRRSIKLGVSGPPRVGLAPLGQREVETAR